ncbi:baseplate hub domain-containing protein [Acinetobacter tianfuensis]|uniref:DUF2163 domain-containing protein n=1 Tax=Acinetobacter tianfuensis TaxID=2419603 RepID=A0A3A8EBD3_9GAMM|nr:DUF2163 domain-containing protein [Acinetobacter tianfuensis]RKG31499.1 DUF2163 domain-containing protein [Acinetobacter tianfuensis]
MGVRTFFRNMFDSATRRELYEFTRGTEKFYYTSGDAEVELSDVVYEQITISRSEIKNSSDLEKDPLEITFARDSKFAQDCLRSALEENVYVKVIKLQHGQQSIFWQGRVVSVKPSGASIILKCETNYTKLGRAGARLKFQRTCCHDLYGNGCRLNKSDWGVQTTIKSVNANAIELRDLSFDDNYFRLGMLQSAFGVSVGIESSAGNTVNIIRRLDSLADQITSDADLLAYQTAEAELEQAIAVRDGLDADDPDYEQDFADAQALVELKQEAFNIASESVFFVAAYPGCMKSLTACSRFNNTENHLGFAYMPEDNPSTTRNA